jgi:hypothetical protein
MIRSYGKKTKGTAGLKPEKCGAEAGKIYNILNESSLYKIVPKGRRYSAEQCRNHF